MGCRFERFDEISKNRLDKGKTKDEVSSAESDDEAVRSRQREPRDRGRYPLPFGDRMSPDEGERTFRRGIFVDDCRSDVLTPSRLTVV